MDDKRQKTLMSSLKTDLICGDSAKSLLCRDVSSSNQTSNEEMVSDAQAVNCSPQSRDVTDMFTF